MSAAQRDREALKFLAGSGLGLVGGSLAGYGLLPAGSPKTASAGMDKQAYEQGVMAAVEEALTIQK